MKRTPAIWLLLAIAIATASAPRPVAAAAPYVGAQFRYWVFSNHNDLRDAIIYWVPGPFHIQLETWDWLDPHSPDQFRPEIGVHLRDPRHSVYTVQWLHELDAERLTFGTEQIVGGPWVARAEVSPIIGRNQNQTVVDAGADYYWRSYNFASATVIRDPRGNDLWATPLRVRLASEANDWLQATVMPTSKRTLGWALDLKWHGVRAGVERNSRYDFTDLDNTIYTLGYERTLAPTR